MCNKTYGENLGMWREQDNCYGIRELVKKISENSQVCTLKKNREIHFRYLVDALIYM